MVAPSAANGKTIPARSCQLQPVVGRRVPEPASEVQSGRQTVASTVTFPLPAPTQLVIDMSDFIGPDIWLFDVQAHSPTAAPRPNTVEDGQLLLLRRG